ncbi:hypothetical protein H6P87_00065 [Rickettsia tillamookensis]|uniref:Uncharacterized protein n=1 Tax=Rickettsia tillamookensis TaxID=2761623 RepID=A0A9E6SPU8_9RICK|nr:hypothetical protein [Rickettsia tillamookensis]QQV74531.1 hypothetical protein H6P87_00065 [Rickettsia tillamookensis]
MDNGNAYIGKNVEILFKNSISERIDIIDKIKDIFKIEGDFLHAINTGIYAEKADVKMSFSCSYNLDVSIKAYKQAIAYNQLTRASISNFCKTFNLNCLDYLQNLIISKSRNVKSNLIPLEEQEKVLSIFQPIAEKMVKWSFSNETARELLVLYQREEKLMRIYVMKDVLKALNYDIIFTNKGNIIIGNYIVIQRKGGNGSLSKTIPKDSIRHPGNNIQLKLKIKDFVNGMKDCELANYFV